MREEGNSVANCQITSCCCCKGLRLLLRLHFDGEEGSNISYYTTDHQLSEYQDMTFAYYQQTDYENKL